TEERERSCERDGSRLGITLRYRKKKFGHVGLIHKYRKYMRLSAAEKYEIILSATTSDIGVKRTLEIFGIHRSTFYKWYQKYLQNGYDGLKQGHRVSRRQWNSIPEEQKDLVVAVALEHTELSSRELAHKITDEQGMFISESSVYRILKQRDLIPAPSHFLLSAADEFNDNTEFVHQMWQADL